MAEKLQVFGFWTSPFSWRVELALKLKGIKYEYIEEDLSKKSDLLLKYNPIYKKVPVLVHNGKPISESLVILEYIEENWKSDYPIFPQDLHERALARFWAKFIDDKFLLSLMEFYKKQREEEKKKHFEEALEVLKTLENELQNKRFFGGEKIGLVDIVGILIACWFPSIEKALGFEMLSNEKFPKLCQWSEDLANHTLVKEILPPMEKMVSHYESQVRTKVDASSSN